MTTHTTPARDRPLVSAPAAKRACPDRVRRSLVFSVDPEGPVHLAMAQHHHLQPHLRDCPTHLDWCAAPSSLGCRRSHLRATASASRSTSAMPHHLTFVLRVLRVDDVIRSNEAHGRVARALAERQFELMKHANALTAQ